MAEASWGVAGVGSTYWWFERVPPLGNFADEPSRDFELSGCCATGQPWRMEHKLSLNSFRHSRTSRALLMGTYDGWKYGPTLCQIAAHPMRLNE